MPRDTRYFEKMQHELGFDGTWRTQYRKACEAVEALSTKDALLLSKIEDKVGALVKTWPNGVRSSMLGSRLDFKTRFTLYLFVAGNVCPPELFVDWIIQRKMLRYKSSARDMVSVIKAHKTGDLEAKHKTYWDMSTRDVVSIVTPNFASETDASHVCVAGMDGKTQRFQVSPGEAFWQNAIDKLEAHVCTLPDEPKSF